MDQLRIIQTCMVVQLGLGRHSGAPLDEQASPYLSTSAFLLLDVDGVRFGSMEIGELINLRRIFDDQWKDADHALGMINVSEPGREVFATNRLDEIFPLFENLSDALRAFGERG